MDKTYIAHQLRPGTVLPEHFRLLINISNIHSEKVVRALERHLVHGVIRKEACFDEGVSAGFFSQKLKQLQYINQMASLLVNYLDDSHTRTSTLEVKHRKGSSYVE
ncbi:PbsX family transcriptional regulator [Escherichia coli]|nr:PbsX family transcriptional regulator [Escherichia coli]EJE0548316.1 PbsX family transcriptional regulator [Escherichia coli]EKM8863942.1 PbsX family transcriptional regulator [Escherichia coli]